MFTQSNTGTAAFEAQVGLAASLDPSTLCEFFLQSSSVLQTSTIFFWSLQPTCARSADLLFQERCMCIFSLWMSHLDSPPVHVAEVINVTVQFFVGLVVFFLIWELFYWFLSLLYHSRELTEIPYMTEINPLSRAAGQRAGALWPPTLESLLHVISPQQCHRSKGHYVDAIFCGELPAVQNHIGLCFFLAELQAPLCCTV